MGDQCWGSEKYLFLLDGLGEKGLLEEGSTL